jgi:hypothetical protein
LAVLAALGIVEKLPSGHGCRLVDPAWYPAEDVGFPLLDREQKKRTAQPKTRLKRLGIEDATRLADLFADCWPDYRTIGAVARQVNVGYARIWRQFNLLVAVGVLEQDLHLNKFRLADKNWRPDGDVIRHQPPIEESEPKPESGPERKSAVQQKPKSEADCQQKPKRQQKRRGASQTNKRTRERKNEIQREWSGMREKKDAAPRPGPTQAEISAAIKKFLDSGGTITRIEPAPAVPFSPVGVGGQHRRGIARTAETIMGGVE